MSAAPGAAASVGQSRSITVRTVSVPVSAPPSALTARSGSIRTSQRLRRSRCRAASVAWDTPSPAQGPQATESAGRPRDRRFSASPSRNALAAA